MWRVEVTEAGRSPLPAIDVDGDELLLGSGEGCAIRLPAQAVHARHLRLRAVGWSPLVVAWVAGDALLVAGERRAAGSSGQDAAPLALELGGYHVTISEAPKGSRAASPQRAERLARELVRSILGGAAPRLQVVAGPELGSSRVLGPPESRLTIGRGDEADWVLLDEDLSRVHAAVVRTWDGVSVVDLGSKNGTRIDGALVPPGGEGRPLPAGARLALGGVTLQFLDEAARYWGDDEPAAPGAVSAPAPSVSSQVSAGPSRLVMALGVVVAAVAVAGVLALLLSG